jgi:hypothetical protein
MLSIGDRHIRQANCYLKRRDSRVRSAFDLLDAQLSSNRQAELAENEEAAEAAFCGRRTSGAPETVRWAWLHAVQVKPPRLSASASPR